LANLRLIARLDVKGPDLIKSVQLEGVRKVGDPRAFARRYYAESADEILYMDAVASLYSRETLTELVRRTAEEVFVPITVGGGLRTAEDVRLILRAGADKVAINSAATHRPQLIRELAERFGSQCVVLQIDAKRLQPRRWEALRDGGREHTGLDVLDWVRQAEELGAGEVLLTSVDREGTRRGFDIDLIRGVTSAVKIPVIASGGMGSVEHLFAAVEQGGADAVAMAHVLHYDVLTLPEIRRRSRERGLMVRSA
jgi:cyclase